MVHNRALKRQNRLHNNNGQAIVEFALAALIFFSLLFAIIDLCIMFYVNLTMQHAVREGTRYAITGQSNLGTDRRSALIARIRNSSNGLYDKNVNVPHDPIISVLPPSKVTFTNYSGMPVSGDPGIPNDIIVIRLTYKWPLLTPILRPIFTDGIYTFTVKTTMKNESFPVP
jgi:Flp pilus assembly protein TadG